MPESELPPKIAEGALLEGNEYGWKPSLFPAALGAKCAAPHRKVICWSGDGAIYYHLTEL